MNMSCVCFSKLLILTILVMCFLFYPNITSSYHAFSYPDSSYACSSKKTSSENASIKENAEKGKNSVNKTHSDIMGTYHAFYSPLTYDKFLAVYNSVDQFPYLAIDYSSYEYDQNNKPLAYNFMGLHCGMLSFDRYYNSVESFDGGLRKFRKNETPPDGKYLERDFSSAEVNAIFQYIIDEDNRDFFFNNDEYEGLEIPYPSKGTYICKGKYEFALTIVMPDHWLNEWAIQKCIDDPASNPIMEGLINLIEDEILTEFEE